MEDKRYSIDLKSFKEICWAMEVLGSCIFKSVCGGRVIDGVDYVPLFAVHDKEDVELAIKIIAKTFKIDLKRLED